MKHQTMSAVSPAASVLSIDPAEVAVFIRKCVQERSLSTLVSDLNDDLLFGTAEQREDARCALLRLGFIS